MCSLSLIEHVDGPFCNYYFSALMVSGSVTAGGHLYMNVYMCICVYMCVRVCIYVHVCVYMCVCMYVCVCVYVCMYMCVCVYVCICVYVHVCKWGVKRITEDKTHEHTNFCPIETEAPEAIIKNKNKAP